MIKAWTDEEVARLIEMYPTKSNREIAEIFNRTVKAVNSKASELGVKKELDTIRKTMATRYDGSIDALNNLSIDEVPKELAFKHKNWLIEHYYNQELSLSDIAEITGCTRKNVEYWMNKFNLDRRDEQTRYTERCLRKISETGKGRVPFSKGLTKHDHPAIMKISEKCSGENSPSWKGGVHNTYAGYRMISDPNHPHANRDGYIHEHRAVMEFILGRLLTRKEVVHHRDCNRRNNVSDNLFLFPSVSAHTSFHNYKRCHDHNISEEKFMEAIYNAQ